jgi:hypothetical protein
MFLICLVYYKTCSETKSLKIKWLGLPDFVPSAIKLMDSELRCFLPSSAHHIKSFFISAHIRADVSGASMLIVLMCHSGALVLQITAKNNSKGL